MYNSFNNELLGTLSLTEACVTSPSCSSDAIAVNKTLSNPVVSSLKFQLSEKSDGSPYAEFKSLELYGELLTTCDKTGIRNTHQNILLYLIIIVISIV